MRHLIKEGLGFLEHFICAHAKRSSNVSCSLTDERHLHIKPIPPPIDFRPGALQVPSVCLPFRGAAPLLTDFFDCPIWGSRPYHFFISDYPTLTRLIDTEYPPRLVLRLRFF
jgi:hypothetical protein